MVMKKRQYPFKYGSVPRKVFSLFPQAVSKPASTSGSRLWNATNGWSLTQTNGSASIAKGVLTCYAETTNARVFATRAVDFIQNHYYCLSVELADYDITCPSALIDNISTVTAPAWGTRNYAFVLGAMVKGGRYCVIVKANATASHTMRIGIGVNSGQTIASGHISLSFRNPMCHEISFGRDGLARAVNDGSTGAAYLCPSPFFGPAEYVPADDVGAFGYEALHTFSGNCSGLITEVEGAAITPHPYAVGGVAGHSWCDEDTDFCGLMRLLMPECAISYRGYGGGTYHTDAISSCVAELLNRPELHPRALPMQWIMLCPPINDILGYGSLTVNPTSQIMTDMAAQCEIIRAANATPILMTCPPLSGAASFDETVGHENYIQQFNRTIRSYARNNGWPLIDVHAIVADPANPIAILSAYTSDHLHLNAAGGGVLAARAAAVVRSLG